MNTNRVQKHSATSSGSARKHQSQTPPDGLEASRSCINCHKRKVRCDRKAPCSQCVRWNWTCDYPSSKREAVRKPSPFEEVTDRLGRLESLLLQVLEKNPSAQSSSLENHREVIPQSSIRQVSSHQPSSKHWEVLLRSGNNIHYVDNSNLLDLFQDEEHIPSVAQTPYENENTPNTSGDLSLTFGISSVEDTNTDSTQLLPDAGLALKLWTAYVENVDPVLKILHIPTTQTAIINLIANPRQARPSLVALAFAIYFAAITSLGDEDISKVSSEDRKTILKRYKKGLNNVITGSDLLNEPDVTSLQAIAIFAACLRVHEIGRAVWVLVGTAIRLAQSIGIHRDGASLKLSPFETEMRIRLWWLLCSLDSRAPEDHGFANTIENLNQNLRLPLNVNDDQLFPTMRSLPPESEFWTEMSFFLAQVEIAKLLQQIVERRPENSSDFSRDLQAKRQMMKEHIGWLSRRFKCNTESTPLQKIANIHFRSAYAKMEFMLQLNEQLYGSNNKRSSTGVPKSLGTSCLFAAFKDIESNHSLISGEASGQYAWLFGSYTKWYSLTYVLRYLCAFPFSPEAPKGWALVNRTFDILPYFRNIPTGTSTPNDKGGSSMWRFLVILYRQALNAKESSQRSSNNPNLAVTASTGPSDVFERTIDHAEAESAPYLFGQRSSEPEYTRPGDPLTAAIPAFGGNLQQEQESAFTSNITTNWQDGLFTFSDTTVPEMFYLPEWNDIVNFSIS